jgi:hypothetical protein
VLLNDRGLYKINLMNTLQTKIIYQSKDSQLNIHFIQVNNTIEYYFEVITPNGVFMDNDYLIGSMYMLKGMERSISELERMNLS